MADQPKTIGLDAELHEYLLAHSEPLDAVAADLIRRTNELGDIAMMQVAPEQAALLTTFARLTGAVNAVEVGTFTGMSSLAIARGLAPGGRLLACDVSEEWTAVATDAWSKAEVADRIELRIAPAIETLEALPRDATIDLAFIDADKTGYIAYHDEIVPRLRPGGVLLVDNVLWSGAVIDETADDESTVAIRAYNDHTLADPRVETHIIPIADGLTVNWKRP